MTQEQQKQLEIRKRRDAAIERYRAMREDPEWDSLTFEEKRDRINRFRAGY